MDIFRNSAFPIQILTLLDHKWYSSLPITGISGISISSSQFVTIFTHTKVSTHKEV